MTNTLRFNYLSNSGLVCFVGKYKAFTFVFKGPECRRQNLYHSFVFSVKFSLN